MTKRWRAAAKRRKRKGGQVLFDPPLEERDEPQPKKDPRMTTDYDLLDHALPGKAQAGIPGLGKRR